MLEMHEGGSAVVTAIFRRTAETRKLRSLRAIYRWRACAVDITPARIRGFPSPHRQIRCSRLIIQIEASSAGRNRFLNEVLPQHSAMQFNGGPMSHTHAVVWLDFKEAHIFLFNAEDVERQRTGARTSKRSTRRPASWDRDTRTTTLPTSRASSRPWRARRVGWSPGRPRPRTSWRATRKARAPAQEPADRGRADGPLTTGELVASCAPSQGRRQDVVL